MSGRLHRSWLEALIAVLDWFILALIIIVIPLYYLYKSDIIDSVTAVIVGSFLVAVIGLVMMAIARVQAKPPAVGPEALIGKVGRVIERIDPEGKVIVEGEIWRAVSTSGPIEEGANVRVVRVQDTTLVVERIE